MSRMINVETCSCKALMRPRWSREEPKVFVCTRCGKPVPGYESLWVVRERLLKEKKNRG